MEIKAIDVKKLREETNAGMMDCKKALLESDGDFEKAKLLLSQGYDLNRDDQLHPKFGTTPLMEACFHGRDDMAKLYIEHNADLNTQSGFGWNLIKGRTDNTCYMVY